mgnify:CR=1 FL=1
MKFFLISDNVDTKMGMRFAGIEGVVVHQEDEVRSELEKAVNRDEYCSYSYYGNTCFALSRPYL